VFAAGLEARRDGQHRLSGLATGGDDISDGELTVRERSCLVERHGPDRPNRFEMRSALDQHTVLRGARDPRDDADGRADHQRTRTREHEECQPALEPRCPIAGEHERLATDTERDALADEQRWYCSDEDCQRNDYRRVLTGKAIDELFVVGLVPLRVLNEFDDAGECAVLGFRRYVGF